MFEELAKKISFKISKKLEKGEITIERAIRLIDEFLVFSATKSEKELKEFMDKF